MGEGKGLQLDGALASLLAKDPSQPRKEPEIAANISTQLKHMELSALPLSMMRRIRDISHRIKPKIVIEVGAGIGNLSAWLFDLWQREDTQPEAYELVEAGPKFGIILNRLIKRYGADDWARSRVAKFDAICAEATAWKLAAASSGNAAAQGSMGDCPLNYPADLIIVDVGMGQSECIRQALPLLSEGGLILTTEPEVPTGDPAEDDEIGQAIISDFQGWMDLVKELSTSHHLAFQPITGGTLVAIIKK
jgi:hypothetical protein